MNRPPSSPMPGRGVASSRRNLNRITGLLILSWIAVSACFGANIFIYNQYGQRIEERAIIRETKVEGTPSATSSIRTQSCSTSNCHGAFTSNPDSVKIRQDEYFVWLNDPHARAYQTLLADQSQKIFQRLGVVDHHGKPLTDKTDQFDRHWNNCVACHETNVQLSSTSVGLDRTSAVAEGVSCESCHGDSMEWRHLHYRERWKRLAPSEKGTLSNFRGSDLVSNIKHCTDCHVGGGKGDVTHELIAAGHPSLKFEYVWYKSRLPKHWRSVGPSVHPAKVWLTGQLVTAIAALEQLERRATDAETASVSWPEYAEYNCFACHHDLNGRLWKKPTAKANEHLIPPWGNWNLDLIQVLASQFDSPSSSESAKAFDDLRKSFCQSQCPLPVAIGGNATAANEKLKLWLTDVSRESDQKSLETLRETLRNQSERLVLSWDQTASIILGIAASYRGSQDVPELLRSAISHVQYSDTLDSPRDFRRSRDEAASTNAKRDLIDILKNLADLIPDSEPTH